MTEPIVFISRNRILPGRLEEFLRHYEASIPLTQASKPNTVVQLGFVNDDKTEFTVVRVFPSAEAMDEQLRGSDVRSKVSYQYIEPTAMEIFGTPSSYTMEMINQVVGAGVAVTIHPGFSGGFVRLSKDEFDGT